MPREPEDVQAIRHELGRQLATFRRAANLTQSELASATYCDRSRIAHLERGTMHADERFWAAVDDIVAAQGILLRTAQDLRIRQEDHRRAQTEAKQAVNRAELARLLRRTDDLSRADHSDMAGGVSRTGQPTPDSTVARTQARWRAVRRDLLARRTELAHQAARLYDPSWVLHETPTIAPRHWIPTEPIPLGEVRLDWAESPETPVCTGEEPELRAVMPLRSPRRAYTRYSTAIRYLQTPQLFENRPSYRLIDVPRPEPSVSLRFSIATYFDRLDVSEALSHEFAAVALTTDTASWRDLPFRSLFTDPFDLRSRAVCPGVVTLTLRQDATTGAASMLLLRRSETNVAVGGGQYGLVPAGEFQPASIDPSSVAADLNLWRNIAREYSEEVLGEPEHDGSSSRPLDYDGWPFYRALQQALETGQIRAYYLGVVLNALSLNAAVLTAVVIRDDTFDRIFRDRVESNAEGTILATLAGADSTNGLPFRDSHVRELTGGTSLGATSMACLAVAWFHRERILAGSYLR